jgi:hypothetical protein
VLSLTARASGTLLHAKDGSEAIRCALKHASDASNCLFDTRAEQKTPDEGLSSGAAGHLDLHGIFGEGNNIDVERYRQPLGVLDEHHSVATILTAALESAVPHWAFQGSQQRACDLVLNA